MSFGLLPGSFSKIYNSVPRDSVPRDSSSARFQTLQKYGVLEPFSEAASDNAASDDLVRLLARICDVPTAALVLNGKDGLWVKSAFGLDGQLTWQDVPWVEATLSGEQLLFVGDTLADERFAQNQWTLQEPCVRFYGGISLFSSDGVVIGLLCVMDVVPRQLSEVQQEAMRVFAAQVVALLELRAMGCAMQIVDAERDAALRKTQYLGDQLDLVQRITHLGQWEYIEHEKRVIWSAEVYRMMGLEPTNVDDEWELLLGFVHPNDVEMLSDVYNQMILHGDLPAVIYRIVRPNGDIRTLHVLSERVWNPFIQAYTISGTVQDITEQRRSSQLLENFFEISIDWMCIVDMNGHFRKINPALTRSLGYSQAELINRPFMEFVHEDDAEKTISEFEHLLADSPTNGFVNRYRAKDGNYRYIEWIVQPFLEDQLLYAVGRDITEQMAARRALRESEQRFSHLFSYAAAGITLSHPQGKFIQVNPAFCAMSGYAQEQLIHLDYADIVYSEDRERIDHLIQKLLDGEVEYFVDEHRYLTQADEIVWVSASISCVYSEDNQPLYMISVSKDITDQVSAQQAVSSLQEQLATTLENMTDAFCILDLNWRVTYLNKEAERVLLHTREQLLNINLWERFPPTRDTLLYQEFNRALSEQVAVHFEIYYPPLDNWFEVHAYPVPDGLAVYFEVVTKRKESIEALRISEERFNIVARATNDAIWDWNLVDDTLWWNEGLTTLFGYERDGDSRSIEVWGQRIHPDDRNWVTESITDLIDSGGEYWTAEYRFVCFDGSIAYVLDRGYVMRDPMGRPMRMVGSMVDLTERRLAEEALLASTVRLQASEEQYRLLFSHNPHPMWVMDLDTLQFMAVNQETVVHYGYSEDEFLSMFYSDLCTIEESGVVKNALDSQRFSQEPTLWHHRIKNGAIIEVELAADIIQFYGREAYLVLATDMTARRRAEEKAKEQAELLDKARDAILVRRLDHTIEYWNHGAELLYGWSAAEAIGRSTRDLLYKDQDVFDRANQQLLEKDELYRELRQVDRFGRELLVDSHWTLVRNEHGAPISVLSISTDITERRKLEAQFLRVQRMESIGTLAGGIAHDLNNVLAPIILSLSVLKRLSKTPLEQKQLALLENSAQRGADMVRQVLLFARGVEGERVVVDIRRVVRDLATMIRETFDRRIEVRVNIEPNIAMILGDPTQIHQVLLNLCVNARDAMPNGGVLGINVSMNWIASRVEMESASVPGNFVVLSISDQGIGIPSAILERIFDPFFTTKGVGKGTGLGLPTVQAVVKSHRGFINVESQEGKGTTFSVYLPAIEDEVVVPVIDANVAQPYEPYDALILVVDDEAAIRVSTQTALEDVGFRVLTADGGHEALTIFTQHQTDISIVLTDMMMPSMDGISLIRELRKIDPDVKIIAATGLISNDVVSQAASLNVKHFLAKPYSLKALLQILAEF